MAQIIPTSTELAFYRQTTSLDGQDYILRLRFNSRLGLWTFNLSDINDDPIIEGFTVVTETNLLAGVADARVPPGFLVARDFSAPDDAAKIKSVDPGLTDLGSRVVLLYFTTAEVEAGFA
jgi:hypothetical protein